MAAERKLEAILDSEMNSKKTNRKNEISAKIKKIESEGFLLKDEKEEKIYEGCSRVAVFEKDRVLYYLLVFSRSSLLCSDYYYSRYKDDGRYSEMRGGVKNEKQR